MNRCNVGIAIPQSDKEVKIADLLCKIYNNGNYKIRTSFQYKPLIYYLVRNQLEDLLSNNFEKQKIDYIINKLIPYPNIYNIIKEEYNNPNYNKDGISVLVNQMLYRKLDKSWKSYHRLKGLQKRNYPGYLVDRDGNRRKIIVCPKSSYDIIKKGNATYLKIFKNKPLVFRVKWNPQWKGKEEKIELIYDDLLSKKQNRDVFKIYQSIKVENRKLDKNIKHAFVDLGIVCPISVKYSDDNQVYVYQNKRIKNDWYKIINNIDDYKSNLKKTNNKNTSYKLRKLNEKSKNILKDYINKLICKFINDCVDRGITNIVIGDLKNITKSNIGRKGNRLKNHYWNIGYFSKRLENTAENYGIKVERISERGTSSMCPRCGSNNLIKRKRLLKCKDCNIEMHRDVAGAYNIGYVHMDNYPNRDNQNRVMAHPKIINIS